MWLAADCDGFIKSMYESLLFLFLRKFRAKLKQNITFIHPACIVEGQLLEENFDPFSFHLLWSRAFCI